MNVVLIYVGSHNELMFVAGKLHGDLIAQFVGVLRRDGSRLKGLPTRLFLLVMPR